MSSTVRVEVVRWLRREGLYTQSSTTYLIFFVWSSFGDTMELMQTGVLGLLLAVFWQCAMVTAFPAGVAGSDSPGAFGAIVASGALFTWLVSWLNFSRLTAITAITTFVWYWMELLDPSRVPRTPSEALNELFGAMVGCAGCMAAIMLPYPFLSISQAQDTAHQLARCLSLTWVDFIDCYCSPEPNAFKQQCGVRDLRGLQKQIKTLEAQLQSAWWESEASRSIRRRRRMLLRLDAFLREAYDRVRGAQNCCLSPRSERGAEEACGPGCSQRACLDVLVHVEPSLRRVVIETGILLTKCIEATERGVVDGEWQRKMERQVELVHGRVGAASTEFFAATGSVGSLALGTEMMSAHAFCLELCAYGRLAAEFAGDLAEGGAPCGGRLQPAAAAREAPWLGSIFDTSILFSRAQIGGALRHTAKILLAFWFGYGGLPHIYMSYDAGAADVMGVMLNRAALGSELEKNFARIQGAVIGTIIGDLAGTVFAGCGPVEQLGKHLLLFCVSAGSFYLYFHSARYADSYLGFILVFFTCKALVKRCDEDSFSYQLFYFDVVDLVAALVIMVALDMAFDAIGNKKPSRRACRAYTEGWQATRESFASLFEPSIPDAPALERSAQLVGAAQQRFAEASSLAVEAALEPRFWRAPWPESLFSCALRHAEKTRLALSCLRYTALCQTTQGEPASALFYGLLRAPAFRKATDMVELKLRLVERKLSKVFEHETEEPTDLLQDPALWEDDRAAWQAAVRELVQEVSHLQRPPAGPRTSLERDPVAQACLIIESMRAMMVEMRSLHEAILQAL